MILNIGGRTDVVHYYSDWLFKRFEEGVRVVAQYVVSQFRAAL